MPEFVPAAKTSEIPEGTGRAVTVGGKRIALFHRAGGSFCAIDDGCTHMGASLAEGSLMGDVVVCPWHAARFSLQSGAAAGPPARGPVKAYPCEVEGGTLKVQVG